jgi:Protein ChrB, N-terminal
VTAGGEAGRWLAVRVPAEPSRHRVAVWRELRRAGAVPLGQGCWAVPDVPAVSDRIARAAKLAGRGDGEVVVLQAGGRGQADAARLEQLFTEARQAEWAELLADCGKFSAEIDAEVGKAKFTLAELEEEEQSLDRLRRWHRELARPGRVRRARRGRGRPAAQALRREAGRLHRPDLPGHPPDVRPRDARNRSRPATQRPRRAAAAALPSAPASIAVSTLPAASWECGRSTCRSHSITPGLLA